MKKLRLKQAYGGCNNFDEALLAIEQHHSAIAKYFYAGYGIRLQNKDSIIALEILNKFANFNIPILDLGKEKDFSTKSNDNKFLENFIKTCNFKKNWEVQQIFEYTLEKIKTALKIAEIEFLEKKAANNETLILSDKDGNIVEIPAKELLKKRNL